MELNESTTLILRVDLPTKFVETLETTLHEMIEMGQVDGFYFLTKNSAPVIHQDPHLQPENLLGIEISKIQTAFHKNRVLMGKETLGMLWSEVRHVDWEGLWPVIKREGTDFRIVELVEEDYLPIDNHQPIYVYGNQLALGDYFDDEYNDFDAWMSNEELQKENITHA